MLTNPMEPFLTGEVRGIQPSTIAITKVSLSHTESQRESYLNTIGFKGQSLWDRVEIKLIKSNLIKRRFLRRGENRSTRGNTTQGREENQQTLPTYDSEVGNRTQATVVGGECSHHYVLAVSFKSVSYTHLTLPTKLEV